MVPAAAGLGALSGKNNPDTYEQAHAFCDLLVIGAGPAGLMAALTAARMVLAWLLLALGIAMMVVLWRRAGALRLAVMVYIPVILSMGLAALAVPPEGALTLVLPLREGAGVSKLVTAGLDTLAVRVPDHPVAAGLLTAFGGPVAAPSANPSGRVSPTTAAHVQAGLDGRIDAVVDGGACGVGVESTIVSCGDTPALLRAGGIPVEAIEACLGQPLARPDDPDTPVSPGQLASHYAPQGHVRLNADAARDGEVLLGFGAVEADLNLSPSGDLVEAAASLFACLHQLDAMGAKAIAVSPIPDHGLGRAINDRLQRAAAPRP